MFSLPTDGSQDTLHSSRNLKLAIQAAKGSLLPDGRNDDEFFQEASAVEKTKRVIFSEWPRLLQICPKKKQKRASSFKCDFCCKNMPRSIIRMLKLIEKNAQHRHF